MNPSDIETSLAGSGLVTADAMAKAFNSSIMSKVLIVGVIAVLMSGFMVPCTSGLDYQRTGAF